MKEDDLTRIEDALKLRLPSTYRDALLSFPVPACAPAGVPPWPPMFALGHLLVCIALVVALGAAPRG